ncbi:hypothetical protein DR56_2828 [Burkholderia pseudomallei MSHR5858]|nr:hypothetical protein DR56_2828 [Burkholderia pseudomallei MSHR5858]
MKTNDFIDMLAAGVTPSSAASRPGAWAVRLPSLRWAPCC